ncbi:MAG: ATP-binding cassette domain-containing protein [Saprospiraceae bacterium]|nr:ATP-binding cassette domain-containing protein [Saprospiraceae bacterium]
MDEVLVNLESLRIDIGQKRILEDLNLEAMKGQWIEIVARNSVGKSVLLNTIYGLNSNYSGSIEIQQLILNANNLSEVRKKIGFCSDSLPLLTDKTIRANLSIALSIHDQILDVEQDEWVNGLLVKFELKSKLFQTINSLSSSQQSLVKLIRSLIHKPKILLLDCIYRNLDMSNSRKVTEVLSDYLGAEQACVIITMDEAGDFDNDVRSLYLLESERLKLIHK